MKSSDPIQAKALPAILIPASDYDRLSNLAATAPPALSAYLRRELARADIVPDARFDSHAARIGSQVTYRDGASGLTRTLILAWPEDADIEQKRVSVLTSIGAALLGMRPHSVIDWPDPLGGTHSLTVLAVGKAEEPGPAGLPTCRASS